jgi:glycosyltransferase involved in cell wall biosynthesis
MQRPCRVLVLNERDARHPAAGGAEVHVAEIARELAGHGFELTQLACGFAGAPARETQPGLEVRRLGPLPVYYPRAVWTTARETRTGGFDVVVEHLNKLPFCAAAYSAVPVLAVNHHLFGESAFLQVAWPIAAGVVAAERLIPRVYRDVPFLAVSESSKQDLVARGIAAAHVEIVHNGIRTPRLAPRPLLDRPRRIAYLGRLEPYKRVELLLRAAARLAPRFPDLDVVLVGRGSSRPALEREARALGLAARTHFAGFVADDERDRLVAEARVCACPSVKEGWGITVIEANALATPVVATDAPGLRDAVRPGETGLLVADGPPEAFVPALADALGRVLADDALAGRLSRGALAWSRGFGWDSAARAVARAIEAALARHRL